ncbi:MAG TPA: methionine--tRNA ligase [Anaerolineae bacterium]|nr:methionine--tRNA ligase [Anaerolineae bacterium]
MIGDDDTAQRYYITTAIPYVNAKPHIGHALLFVLTDALARYHRLKGDDVRFQTGTDENSLKNVQAAEREGIPTQALVDRNAGLYYALRDSLSLSFDDFIRTSVEPRHVDGVDKLWQACDRSGDIAKRAYRGLYCVGCEQFYAEDELVDGLCPDHLIRPEIVEEENYFFRLSRYADRLIDAIDSDRLRIVPQTRKNEVLSFIRRGLVDFSISRSKARARGWGIPVPGDPDQVMYVWFDALGNYITALDYAGEGEAYQRYWVNGSHRVHIIGKDIIRFHAVYWPAMLLSAGVPLPTDILVHSFITIDGRKISKSLGNTIDPVDLARRYGVDALRYYLLREVRTTSDGDFALERFIRAYNADLADQLGNLLSRVVSMVDRYYGGVVPAPGGVPSVPLAPQARMAGTQGTHLMDAVLGLRERVDEAMSRFAPHDALAAIWDVIGAANKYVDYSEPWVLAKRRESDPSADARLSTVLYNLVETLRLVAHYSSPFIPTAAESILRQLGLPSGVREGWSDWGRYPAGTAVQPGNVLFPKIE